MKKKLQEISNFGSNKICKDEMNEHVKVDIIVRIVIFLLEVEMTTFNTYDYDFLSKCLVQGSLVFKAESIKRLTNLAVNDKKQFVPNSKQVLVALEQLLCQEREDINILATILLSQILINIVSKDNQYTVRAKHLGYVVQNLGHVSKPAIRKASHTCLLAYIKTYHNFDHLLSAYMTAGFQNESYLIRQKSINSFQSILLLQMKYFNWESQESRKLVENLISNLNDNNPYISKASAQCLLSMCKIDGVKTLASNLGLHFLVKLKNFLEDTLGKVSSTQTQISVEEIDQIINSRKKGNPKLESKQVQKQPPPNHQPQQRVRMLSNQEAHQRRLEKIKKSLAEKEEKKINNPQQVFHGKMFGNVNTEGSLKERTEAAQELLYKIQVNKNKPQFETSVKHIIPNVVKMLRDPNPKIVGVSLKILENVIQQTKGGDFNMTNNLASIIVEKLGDQKISIRQMVSKVIKQLIKKTDKAVWIRQLLDNLRRNTNTFLKDETLSILHFIYEEFPANQITYNTNNLLQQIVVFTDDPKTKIKIRTLDCLSQVSFKTSVEDCNDFLKGKMPEVFYQMYVQKVNRLVHEREKKLTQEMEKSRKNQLLNEQNSYKTSYHERGHLLRRETDRTLQSDTQQLNVSIDVARKRVAHLKKPRNILSTQQTVSLDNTQRTIDKNLEDVELMLPSLYKKTKTNRFTMKKGEFSPTKTIENKNSDYLSKEDLKPLRQPQKQLKSILSELKDTDWKAQFETINKLRRLTEFNPELILNASVANMHAIIFDLLGLIESLRSSVSKNALICLNELILVMNRQIDPQMEIIMEKLMKKSADTNIFISSQVQKCLVTLATRASETKVIEKLLVYKESKNLPIKDACLYTLLAMKDDERIRQKEFSRLTESFSMFLGEGQQDLRTRAKVGIIQICKSLGDWYRILRGKMNPVGFKSVCELMTKANGNSQCDLGSNSQPKRNRQRDEMTTISADQTPRTSLRVSSIKRQERSRKKAVSKVSQFPQQFSEIATYLDESNSTDWKKRIQSLNKMKNLALTYSMEFSQYRSASHFIDVMSKQMLQPNLKVSTNALECFLEVVTPLKSLIEGQLSVISTSIFNSISSNRNQVKQLAEKCTNALMDDIDIPLLLPHICHGILYALPKSRVFLVNKLNAVAPQIYGERKQLLFKHVFPTLNKLMDQYKTELMPHIVNLFLDLYEVMGNNMFSHLTKFKEVRELISK